MSAAYDVVVPTIGRPSLDALLDALAGGATRGYRPGRILVVDDRPEPRPHRALQAAGIEVLHSGGKGPAAARNIGWRAATAPWVVFLDDDVVPRDGWATALQVDLDACGTAVAGSQGRIEVPLPAGRKPTDWERNVAGLESARWATADMAYRRDVLEDVGGFDARFPRAYREDADLALRVRRRGYELTHGRRTVTHPVRPAGPLISLRLQKGNRDDALMRALHGRGWRAAAQVGPGRIRRHLVTTAAGAAALAAAAVHARRLAALSAAVWFAGTAELGWARIGPGPRSPREVATMTTTSLVLPFVAAANRLAGELALRRRLAEPAPNGSGVRTEGER